MERAIAIRQLPTIRHRAFTVTPESPDEGLDGRELGRDAVGDGGRDAHHFLEHLDVGVGGGGAGFDLAGFHAECCGEGLLLKPLLC